MNKEIICGLISENLIEEAINELLLAFQNSVNYNEVIQQSNKFHEYQQRSLRGTESFEELNRMHANITISLINLTDKIPKKGFNKYNFAGRLSQWCVEISKQEKERTELFKKIGIEKAIELDYKIETTEAISITFGELVDNAFQHGCLSANDNIKIKFEITTEYIALNVSSPSIIEFDLKDKISECIYNLEVNPFQKRGRGLVYINELSDEFSLLDKNTFKVVFYNDNCDFLIREIDSTLILIDVVSGIENPSFSKKLTYIVNHLSSNDYTEVILSFRAFTQSRRSTVIVTITIELSELLASQNKKFVAILRGGDGLLSKVKLPNLISTYSWIEALNRIERPEMIGVLNSNLEDIVSNNSKYSYLINRVVVM
jgi:anti-sigma regulatory factor (Ser/Thr protein kinase)